MIHNLIDVSGTITGSLKRSKSLYLPAKKLFIDPNDILLDRQRNPDEDPARQRRLRLKYGEKGERFNTSLASAITVIDRHNGMYAIKDGGGRWWVVMNLLKKPDVELLCVVVDQKTIDDTQAFLGLNDVLVIPNGKKFMTMGNKPENKYHFKICSILKEFGLTTAPGSASRIVKVNPIIFAHDLHLLRRVLHIATKHWGGPALKRRLEGIGIAGLTGFLYIYGDDIDDDRLHHALRRFNYDDLKAGAINFLPKNKEHQRQYGRAMARAIIAAYNANLRHNPKGKGKAAQAVKPLDETKLAKLPEMLEGHKNFELFSQVWEMRKL